MGAVVTALRPNFRLAKLEGDAAFTFAKAETIDGSMLLDTIERGSGSAPTPFSPSSAWTSPTSTRPPSACAGSRRPTIGSAGVAAWAHDLERRWLDEEDRRRVLVSPEESVLTMSVPTNVPPQVAWEFLTTPGGARRGSSG